MNTYKEINPYLELHDIYTERHAINDLLRISFTKLRLSEHNLAIETGRRNRIGRGRLPVEERICVWLCAVRDTWRCVHNPATSGTSMYQCGSGCGCNGGSGGSGYDDRSRHGVCEFGANVVV
ncbi:hypothetical protein E2C01_024219 [Portunus trituberculatus]|uniref:Uncharacterized protein n=1 Tax=Portunus trituberculatus TaxID=210409 RepID=A0A5B7EC78_PORTR|nr:hypothetical protein [Portunus trituberculatus]